MRVINIHERELDVSAATAGDLIDRLASDRDVLWPVEQWPPMKFDRPLGVGAVGGHGPIRYVVDAYEAGRNINFRFTKPRGFRGGHRFEINELSPDRVILRHTIEMRTAWSANLSWFVVIRPLHNALMEDALDRAEVFAGGRRCSRRYSFWLRFLRWSMKGRRPVRVS